MRNKNVSTEEKVGYVSMVREAFDQIRHQKKRGFSLQLRLFTVVVVGLFISIWIGYGVAELLKVSPAGR